MIRSIFIAAACGLMVTPLAFGQAAESQPEIRTKRTNLYDSSLVLLGEENHTIVPVTAVLHVPEAAKSKVTKGMPKQPFLFFTKFYPQNTSWLATHEVTLEQARGKAPIDKEVRKSWEEGNRVVIATFKGNPVTCHPYVPEGEAQKKVEQDKKTQP